MSEILTNKEKNALTCNWHISYTNTAHTSLHLRTQIQIIKDTRDELPSYKVG